MTLTQQFDQPFDQRKTTLDNGLVVLTETVPHTRAVSFGVFLRTGSRFERAEQNGLTHFIEHAVFKGTRRRSALQIANEADALGGNLNAYTSRESVGFHNEIVDNDLHRGFELLTDLVLQPAFDPTELDKERNVILEEIKMTEDAPDDVIFDIFTENFYVNHPLGRRILGTPDTLATFKDARLIDYFESLFSPANLVVAAAGNLAHDEIIELAAQTFGASPPRAAAAPTAAPAPVAHLSFRYKAELEQAHLTFAVPCPSVVSEKFYTVGMLSNLLGGGLSSRLFQAVREERGLAYDVSASASQFQDAGYFQLYAATSPDKVNEAIAAMMDEIKRIKAEPVTFEELERTRGKMRTGLILAFESAGTRLSAMVGGELTERRFIPLSEVVEKVEAVTAEDVQQLANEIFTTDAFAATVVGKLKGYQLKRSQFAC
jgi:predicted Zn-dependent peptidase